MSEYVEVGNLRIDKALHELMRDEIAPGTGVDPAAFWQSLDEIVRDLGPENAALLEKRDCLQKQLDNWHRERKGQVINTARYRKFLLDIGYIVPEGDAFEASTANVDPEIATVAGPQLVVPGDNARYALNAANARWGSLYDALYGSDAIADADGAERRAKFNPVRGARVVEIAAAFLDSTVSLAQGSYADVTGFELADVDGGRELRAHFRDGRQSGLADRSKFAGFNESGNELENILLRNNSLHIEIQFDREKPIGRTHPAGINDVILESAITTIQDYEDSVAAVDAEDKVRVYRNWLGMMKGTLETTFNKSGQQITRKLNADRTYTAADGKPLKVPGRSLLLVRNVGLHMVTDAVTTTDGKEIPEGFLDVMVTCLAAIHDLEGQGSLSNSRAGSIYIVKPKLHGPEEVAATVKLFSRVEDALGLTRNTIKIGIMDEERRLTVNLKESIREARERVIFINTGFLDRTGDEIHTIMEAGPVVRKADMKATPWILAYEDHNVDIGIETGLPGKAQIGKGMWAMPDEMRAMLDAKAVHPKAGANTAWVPSPTAATLHAMHYHEINVAQRQKELANRERASIDQILTLPILGGENLSDEDVQNELDNNVQSILGYVVRWVDQGVGCSKVPDINDLGLMEDRATLRISSQHIANWLHHGVTRKGRVIETLKRMAAVVDRQNSGDANYRNMAPNFDDSVAFQAAMDLVFQGCAQPNGYTEPVLHARRRQVKASLS
ncbi:MAG: malate synthase G [Gammaproteobacteria bacterium]|nr:MAG: malate synthase G [Gammaproteobacteria bacterium]